MLLPVLTGLIALGIILVVIALLVMISNNKKQKRNEVITVNSDNANDPENTVSEIDKIAKQIFEEMEGKYQELLFLYSLIDEKKKEISTPVKTIEKREEKKTELRPEPEPAPIAKMPTRSVKGSKFEKIEEMYDSGMSFADIARTLNMGQGEVALIYSLGKGQE